MDLNMITAEEARKLAGKGYEQKTAELHQAIRERAMQGFCYLDLPSEHYFPEGVLKDLGAHGFKVQKVPKQREILIKW